MLRAGSCVSANCNGSSDVIPGLGICLSELVRVPSSTNSSAPVPSTTGLTDPTVTVNSHHSLAWWQILLMALGCAFIFILILMLWRRRARKQRVKQTAMFASAKKLDGGNGWRWRLEQLRKRLFGKKKGGYHTEVLPIAYHDVGRRPNSLAISSHSRILISPNRDIKPKEVRIVENRSTKRDTADDLDNIIGHYAHSTHSRFSRAPSTLPGIDDYHYPRHNPRRIERDSLYSEATGNQRLTPEPRQPLKRDASKLLKSPVLIDLETQGEKAIPSSLPLQIVQTGGSSLPTDAQAYAMSARSGLITVSTNTASPQPPTMPSSFIRTTTPMTLTPTPPLIGQAQGPYWLSPVVNTHPIGGSQQQFHLLDDDPSALDTVVLQPMNTGGSSRNPFRQGAF